MAWSRRRSAGPTGVRPQPGWRVAFELDEHDDVYRPAERG